MITLDDLPLDELRDRLAQAKADHELCNFIDSTVRMRREKLRCAEQIRALQSAIRDAANPVVMAGGGALSPGAPQALSTLQDLACLPVFTTNMGKGAVDERHPLSCGVLGALVGPASLGSAEAERLQRVFGKVDEVRKDRRGRRIGIRCHRQLLNVLDRIRVESQEFADQRIRIQPDRSRV